MKAKLLVVASMLAACKPSTGAATLFGQGSDGQAPQVLTLSFATDPATIKAVDSSLVLDDVKALSIETGLTQQFVLPTDLKAGQWFKLKKDGQQPLRFRLAVTAGDKLCIGHKIKLGAPSVTLECSTKPKD